MHTTALILLALASVSAHRLASPHLSTKRTLNDGTPTNAAYIANDPAWEEYKTQNPRMLVAFYFPRCHACQTLQPHWDAAVAFMEADEYAMEPLISVDCANGVDGDLCRPYTEGFPTIRFFTDSAWEHSSVLSYNRVLKDLPTTLDLVHTPTNSSDISEWTARIVEFAKSGGAESIPPADHDSDWSRNDHVTDPDTPGAEL
jgi:hypothetical protein